MPFLESAPAWEESTCPKTVMRHDSDGSARLLIRSAMVGQAGAGGHGDKSTARTPREAGQ